jgi:hypothetical protein
MSEQNPIKKANIETEFTQENVADLLRCRTDPVYFMEKFMFVQHPKFGKMPFKLYEYQRKLVRHFHDNRFSIGMLGRQQGKCFTRQTSINTILKPTGFRKWLLWIVDRKTYDQLFHTNGATK